MFSTFLLFAALAQSMDPATCPMHEQHTASAASPYVGRTALPVKALTPETIAAYQNGTGNGMALPAEMNGYPGPRHVLDLGDKLQLTGAQKTAIQQIFDRMHATAVQLGPQIIDREKALDALFASGSASDAEVARLTGEIAELQGRLRATHLQAHIAAKAILTADQVKAYDVERGYASGGEHQHHHE